MAQVAKIVRRVIRSPKVVAPLAPYNHGIQVDNTLYISGQIGLTPDVKLLDGIEAQTRQSLQNIGHILEAAGATFNNVVKVTVLMADIHHFDIMNKVYSEFFTNVLPARAAYQVAVLPKNALIEIEAVAAIGDLVDAPAS